MLDFIIRQGKILHFAQQLKNPIAKKLIGRALIHKPMKFQKFYNQQLLLFIVY